MESSIVMYNFGVGHGGPYKSANLEGHQSNLLLWDSGWNWDVDEARTDTKVIHYTTTWRRRSDIIAKDFRHLATHINIDDLETFQVAT